MIQTDDPIVSIITPFFNVENFLAETIESVVSQTYENWQLILIDDGSSDKSSEIAALYVRRFPEKIILLAHENNVNRGASPSRYLGLSIAKGELVAFLDSDDYWLPQKLQTQVDILQQNPDASVLCEATKFWVSWSKPESQDAVVQVLHKTDRLYKAGQLVPLVYPFGKGSGFCTCALLVKKQVLDEFGSFDDSFIGKNQLFEDQVLFVKLYLHANVYISSICNNYYRQRTDSLMHRLYTEGYAKEGKYFFLNWFKQYLEKNNIDDNKIHRSLRQAYLPYQYPLFYKSFLWVEAGFKKLRKGFSF